jgi:phosphatidylserine decarboxylase
MGESFACLDTNVSLTTFAVAQLIRALPRVQLSRVVGALAEKSLSPWGARSVERVYRTFYDVDLSEADKQGPFSSFDAFFTRELKPGMRPIGEGVLVSPADGQLSALGPIDGQGTILVKRQQYDVAELIGSAELAARYLGGEFAVVYLSPRDYHRVHSPVDGVVSSVVGIPGDLYPVNSVGEQHFAGLFVRNNRVAIHIDTPNHGRVTVIMVGATIVGRISLKMIPEPAVPPGLTRFEPGVRVARGDELGTFHLGSTAVILLEPGLRIGRGAGEVRYGAALSGDR